MNDKEWAWAKLSADQLTMLKEAETTLDPNSVTLLAFQPEEKVQVQPAKFKQEGIKLAALNNSQVECLVGLEQKLGTVVVAYR